MSARVVCFGEVMLRLSSPRERRLSRVEALAVHVAGAEANVAVDLALLGVPAAWVGVLPDGPLGDRAAAELAGAGVDLGHVDRVPGRMGLFFVEHGAGARPTQVHYDRADSAFALDARWPAGALDGARYAVVSGITPALSPAAAAATTALADEAAADGCGLVVDVNFRARLWSAEACARALRPLLQRAEVVLCSAADARGVLGLEPDPLAVAADVAPQARAVVVTRGADEVVGAFDGVVHRAVPPPTEIVDRLGMGDALLAGMLFGLLEGAEPAEVLTHGTTLAALAATVAGDHAHATRADLLAAGRGKGAVLR
jgi:2-dehydro-3-deoxygluconokinase